MHQQWQLIAASACHSSPYLSSVTVSHSHSHSHSHRQSQPQSPPVTATVIVSHSPRHIHSHSRRHIHSHSYSHTHSHGQSPSASLSQSPSPSPVTHHPSSVTAPSPALKYSYQDIRKLVGRRLVVPPPLPSPRSHISEYLLSVRLCPQIYEYQLTGRLSADVRILPIPTNAARPPACNNFEMIDSRTRVLSRLSRSTCPLPSDHLTPPPATQSLVSVGPE